MKKHIIWQEKLIKSRKENQVNLILFTLFCTAIILADLVLDKESIVAGLLHVLWKIQVLQKSRLLMEFSEEVADLVDGVTKITKLDYGC